FSRYFAALAACVRSAVSAGFSWVNEIPAAARRVRPAMMESVFHIKVSRFADGVSWRFSNGWSATQHPIQGGRQDFSHRRSRIRPGEPEIRARCLRPPEEGNSGIFAESGCRIRNRMRSCRAVRGYGVQACEPRQVLTEATAVCPALP